MLENGRDILEDTGACDHGNFPPCELCGMQNQPEKEADEKSSIKEGVDFVFEENHELAAIGSKEEYSEYLKTIFPDSKIRNIVYHGTRNKFEKFSREHLGSNTGSPSAFNGFFFASSAETSVSYVGEQVTEYIPEFVNYRNQYAVLREENLKRQKEISQEMAILWNRKRDLLKKIIDSAKGIDVEKLYEGKVAELDKLQKEEKELWEKDHMLDKTVGGYTKLTGRKTDEIYDTYMKAGENTHVLAVLLDIKNPGVHDDEGKNYRRETYNNRTLQDKAEGKDATIIRNTQDFSVFTSRPVLFGGKEINKDTDVYVVFEPEQIHILGSELDREKFKEFITKSQMETSLRT